MAHNSAQVSGLRKTFCLEFVDEGRSCKFQANVNIPGDISKVNEMGKRIVNYHGLAVELSLVRQQNLLSVRQNGLSLFLLKDPVAVELGFGLHCKGSPMSLVFFLLVFHYRFGHYHQRGYSLLQWLLSTE